MSSSFIRLSEVPLESSQPNHLSVASDTLPLDFECISIDEPGGDCSCDTSSRRTGSSSLPDSQVNSVVTDSTSRSSGENLAELPITSSSSIVNLITMRDDKGGIVNWSSLDNVTPIITITIDQVSSDEDSEAGSSSVFYETGFSDKTVTMATAYENIIDPEQDHNSDQELVDSDADLHPTCDSGDDTTGSQDEEALQDEPVSDGDGDASLLSPPHKSKLRRLNSSTLSQSNLSDISESETENALKVEELRPKRRNTLADIFRWLIESDSKSFNSLPGANNGHSRKSSDTSELSFGQGSDKASEETEEDLWITWGRIVNEWETYWKKKNQIVRDLVRRGIPHHFRGIVWQLLCGAHDSPDKAKYADYIKATSACEKVIRRDIARTYPEHEFFKEKDGLGQESLFNVMKAYSLHDREVGYCQGSAFIVGLLLMQMPEEEAFAVVVKLMQDYRLREMFKPSMAELGLVMYQLEMCVQEQLPELHVHFTSQGFHTSMYASSWFLTIFTTSLPLAVASRIMDMFLMEGIEVVFRVAIAILHIAKIELLSLDMEGMLKFLQKELPPRIEADPESLFLLAYQMKYNAKKMKKLEKEYAAMKTKEQEEMVELRRLRTENKLLKQRIEVLESESSELANKLIQGQVGRAEEVETTFALKRELAAVRQHYLEAMKHLENVTQQYQHLLLVLDETNNTKQTSMDEISLKSEMIKQKEELIQCLQNELVEVRLQEAENAVIMSDLRSRIQELEEDKKKLRESVVDNSVAHLQEELIAVKLREAEASLSLKDLRQKVADLTGQWQKRMHEHEDSNTEKKGTSTPLGNLFTSSRVEVQRLEEEVMTLKLREMETIIELKEHRLKIMELETQVQVTSNQLKRQEDESRHLKEELESTFMQNKELHGKMKDERRRYTDLESRLKEDSVHARIKDAEKSQRMFDLSQQISSLKLKNQELLAEKELNRDRCISSNGSDKSDSEMDTQDRIKELEETISTLTAQIQKLQKLPASKQSSSSSSSHENRKDLFVDVPLPKENGHGTSEFNLTSPSDIPIECNF
ncbi:unnamed protein product [Allacma fusca]|uniref:Rab-GAP TBC domain-containing protein n=1 Tax=Allacma fusca TaxID=39272 RepID=A0A8J2PX80_9HEXA|nr:unnamed protein product [Allacma fusca]